MTAMVDVAFLLLTFFILTTKFRPTEAVVVDTPTSVSHLKVPQIDFFMVTVAKDGRVFVGLADKNARIDALDRMASYGVKFTEAGRNYFAATEHFGVPIAEMSSWLSQPTPDKMKNYPQRGIPIDKTRGKRNDLKEWVMAARRYNIDTKFMIKGDLDVSYEKMSDVIWTLQDANVNKFNLVTGLEADPSAAAPAEAEEAGGEG